LIASYNEINFSSEMGLFFEKFNSAVELL